MKLNILFKVLVFVAITLCCVNACDKNKGDKTEVIRLSHPYTRTHPSHFAALTFKSYVEAKLPNKYNIEIYPKESLGSNEKALDLVKQGSIQFLISSSVNLEYYDRSFALFSIPYLFVNEKAFENFITNSLIIDKFKVNVDKTGFIPLTAFFAGTRSFYTKKPIHKVDDLKGMKIRVQAGPFNIRMMQAFGAIAIPMSFGEVYKALEQGIIDGAANNEIALVNEEHGKFAKYYSYDKHQMCPDMFIVSSKFMERISKEDRHIFEKAAKKAQEVQIKEFYKSRKIAKEQALSLGVTFIDVDIDEFKDKVLFLRQVILDEIPEIDDLYNEVLIFNKKEINKN